jgi:acyl transferase domain-containing protein
LFVLSGKSPEALNAAAGRLFNHLVAHPDLSNLDAAWSLAATRAHHEHRLAITASSLDELLAALESASRGAVTAGVAWGRLARRRQQSRVRVPRAGILCAGGGRFTRREPTRR